MFNTRSTPRCTVWRCTMVRMNEKAGASRMITQTVRHAIPILVGLFFLAGPTANPQPRDEAIATSVLADGTTIIQAFGANELLRREEIILRNGRHKTTYFDSSGEPKYGIVSTGTGAFGMMYYDQEDAPLFKFWDYGGHDYLIQIYSTTFERIESVRIGDDDGERVVRRDDGAGRRSGGRTRSPILWSIVGLVVGVPLGMRLKTVARRK